MTPQDLGRYAAQVCEDPKVDDHRRPNPFPYSESEDVVLPEDYTPTKHDVINGRGRKSYNHIANRKFRQLIGSNLSRYLDARCKVDKTLVVVGIVNAIRNATPTGAFLKKCSKKGRWVSMSNESAREKVGHCLRDMIASQRDDKKFGGSGLSNKPTNETLSRLGMVQSIPKLPSNIPWVDVGSPAKTSSLHPSTLSRQPPIPNIGSAVKEERNGYQPATHQFFLPAPGSASIPPPALSINNLDAIARQRGNMQDMSDQQRKILIKLEGGFKGSVEELMEAVK